MKSYVINSKFTYFIFTVLFIVLNPGLAFAQDANKKEKITITVQDLVVPNAPASAIIGSQISIKPAITPKAFGLSILNSISNEEGEFPNNIAVEFAPYWWSPKPNLTFDDYYNKNGFGEFIFQTLSFSIASDGKKIKVDDNEVDGTKLGLGLRMSLIAGKANPQVEQVKKQLLAELKNCLALRSQESSKGKILVDKLIGNKGELEEKDFLGLLETMSFLKMSKVFEGKETIVFDILTEKIELLSNSQTNNEQKTNQLKEILSQISQEVYGEKIDKNDIKQILLEIRGDAAQARIDKCLDSNQKIGELNTSLENLDKARVGLQLESASAVGFDFPEDDFDELRFRNFATWLTASYRGKKSSAKEASPIEFLGVARYTLDELEDNTNNFFDVGAGLVYRLQKTPLSFSLEYVRRFGDDEDDRFVGVADYRINNTYSVFLSYGKDFEKDQEFDGNGDVVTLFGLKVGLGRDSAVQSIIPSDSNTDSSSSDSQ